MEGNHLQPRLPSKLNTNNRTQSSIIQQFKYKVLEDDIVKYIDLNEINRVNNTKLTIVILNTVDTEVKYNLIISTQVSGTLEGI
jgi:hypothetical protein